MSLSSLSAYRLKHSTTELHGVSVFGDFSVFASKDSSVVKQYYIVPSRSMKHCSDYRVEPLAHIVINSKTQKRQLKTYQPELFHFQKSEEDFLSLFDKFISGKCHSYQKEYDKLFYA
ncbi:hypothetical protein [Shewanella indica]|uniref:hypothetical protein n=1 Tax=Shewanella indica TaxID=768528 RepID=UPI0030042655